MKINRLISIYISFIAVVASMATVLWSTYSFKNDLKITTFLIAIFASILGIALSIFYRRLTTKKSRSKIFISHSSEDSETADRIRRELQDERFILNIDEKNIMIGENIKEKIRQELESSSIVILLISKNSTKSKYLEFEIDKALKEGKKIMPILLDKEAQIPEPIKDLKFADWTVSTIKRQLPELVRSLKHQLETSA